MASRPASASRIPLTLFYLGVIGLALFEFAKVYFIMPMPGSQRLNSLDAAYLLHDWRWAFRALLVMVILGGAPAAFAVRWRWRWIPAVLPLITAVLAYETNVVMMADQMFKQPEQLVLAPRASNKVDENSVVIGVELNGEAKAWPIRYILYHHQVQDTIGGKAILVTYCNVCRSGRVFDPFVG